MNKISPKDIILLYARLNELLADLQAGDSAQLNRTAIYQYDALYADIKKMVDDPKFGAISPSFRFPPPDTIGRLHGKTILLERYFRNYICYQHPDLASHIWGVEVFGSSTQNVTSEQRYIIERLDNTRRLVEGSPIEEGFRKVAIYDLQQATVACKANIHKACIVMLGAVLESLMLGTIRRPAVIDRLRADASSEHSVDNYPKKLLQLGPGHPEIADKIARELDFERYKEIICYLIPDIEKLKVENIQKFRNAIHPWNTVSEPAIYENPSPKQIASYAGALEILAEKILKWNP